jgi:hypothetical protein
MHVLNLEETDTVSGGWEWSINIGDVVEISGDGSELVAAYDWAVDKTADFFCWWDPMDYFDNHC